jgi:arginine decarboxylase
MPEARLVGSKSAEIDNLYGVSRWGSGYFSVSPRGTLQVHPNRDPSHAIDLIEVIESLRAQNVDLPVLLRFDGILRDRIVELHDAFLRAIADHQYQGDYRSVYPVKVNPQRTVVERVLTYGRPFGLGLEAGSKPELLAVIAMTDSDVPVVCNGFKDPEFIEMVMLAQKIGRWVVPIVERYSELELILEQSARVGVRPKIGVRFKPASRGSGRWQQCGGYRSKFGLTATELLRALNTLQERGMADCLQLLHFHLGSQITSIRCVKEALIEAARVYAELVLQGAKITHLDVGGGLGVDYDGSRADSDSSMNYTLQEYANDVVYHVQTVCDEMGVPHPNLISESGRALSAHHSALVFDVLGVVGAGASIGISHEDDDQHLPLRTLRETFAELHVGNLRESLHDAQQSLEMALNLFNGGYMRLEQRAAAERLFASICREIRRLAAGVAEKSEELKKLDDVLSDIYTCNFSLFQSLPDSWAIDQFFPVMPIHKLDQLPTRRGILADITCDSDGKLDLFYDPCGTRGTLPLHEYDGSPYYLATFLVGAYQEILGDLHNLFGDTNTAHVNLRPDGTFVLDEVTRGETVNEVLRYVRFDAQRLVARLEAAVNAAIEGGRIGAVEAEEFVTYYREALHGYTYLEEARPETEMGSTTPEVAHDGVVEAVVSAAD